MSTVLIVDDSLTVRMDLDEAFRSAGFETALVKDLAGARDALAARTFALVVLDVLLPDGDGLTLLEELQRAPATVRTPVMLLSSETEVRDRIRGLRVGADEYVGKPYDVSYVVGRAREIVRRRDPGAAERPRPLVLVIDDSLTAREELRATLERSRYAVITAPSGEDGLRAAVAHRPDAIIVDGALPGIDGATVIRRIRADGVLRRTPCMLLTGSSTVGELGALDAGADAYLRKDEGHDVITARLQALLRSAGPAAPVETASVLASKKILAVDDSATYHDHLSELLREEGYDVVLARSGEEALQLLEVERVDCILLDLVMPGLSGRETCQRIKRDPALRDVPLLILTAVEDHGTMVDGINAGADDFVSKSADVAVLRARIRAQLRRKQFEDENRFIREQLLRKELEAAEARAAREVAEMRAALLGDLRRKNAELAAVNAELESFAHSVSHDLRAPLRQIRGFTQALIEEQQDRLDPRGREDLREVSSGAERMGALIDAMLSLARLSRGELRYEDVDLGALAREILDRLRAAAPGRDVRAVVSDDLHASGDPVLLRAVLENLLGNAWKFTARRRVALIEVGARDVAGERAFFVRDDGAGFDTALAGDLFRPFRRLHSEAEFEGTGIGLATVKRVVQRHGGRVWAEATVGQGATFYFTLGREDPRRDPECLGGPDERPHGGARSTRHHHRGASPRHGGP